MRYSIALLAGLTIANSATAQPAAQDRVDLLDLAAGALVVSASSEYNDRWSAARLLDGTTKEGWCSADGEVAPNTIVVELPQLHVISAVAVDTTGAQEAQYAGISARRIVVSGSRTSSSDGFVELVTIEAPRGGRREVALAAPAQVQWLRFEIRSNWGNAEYTELMELEAYGTPVGPSPLVSVAGVYQTDYGMMRLEQDGAVVRGCYDCCSIGQLTGSIEGRVLRFEWREDKGLDVGTAMMVASSSGDTLTGFYFRNGRLDGAWNGRRVVGRQAECTIESSAGLAGRLKATGTAVMYGITFDSNSAKIKAESETALAEVVSVLQGDATLRLLVVGHTDSTNTDEYNLRLSQQRADAVVAWLIAHGCDGARLRAVGRGESEPIAENGTAVGRALNRRVEIRVER